MVLIGDRENRLQKPQNLKKRNLTQDYLIPVRFEIYFLGLR